MGGHEKHNGMLAGDTSLLQKIVRQTCGKIGKGAI